MFVDYKIDVARAKASIAASPQLSPYGEERLQQLVDKLEELTEDICLPAEDLIRVLTIHAQLCAWVAEQALDYVREDGDLPKFGG